MKHIFIIEDNMGILEGLTFLLEKTYRVTALSDARIALKKLPFELPDMILLDLLMPDLNGTEFIDVISKRGLNIPILMMSASRNVSAPLNYASVAGFIHKPFHIDELLTTIEKVIGSDSR
jgi:DNA-binding NtrC family response regulator